MAILYRAVSLDELADLRRHSRLRAVASSCEGKHLASTRQHAMQWGLAFYGASGLAAVRPELPDPVLSELTYWPQPDGI